jgi:hypothetical protein
MNTEKPTEEMKLRILFAIVLLIASVGCSDNYSNGSRVGTITKFSRRGFWCKSWEGEIVSGGLRRNSEGGSEANVFRFSVEDDKTNILSIIGAAVDSGKRVKLDYRQTTYWEPAYDTSYRITGATELKD